MTLNIENRSKQLAVGFVKQAALPMQGLGNFIIKGLYKDIQNSVNAKPIEELIKQHVPNRALVGGGIGALAGSGIGGLISGIKGYRAAEGSVKDRLKAGLRKSLRGAGIGAGIGAGLGTGAGILSGLDDAAGVYVDKARQTMNNDVNALINLGAKAKGLDSQYRGLLEDIASMPVGVLSNVDKNRANDLLAQIYTIDDKVNEAWLGLMNNPYASRTLIKSKYPALLRGSNWWERTNY